MTNFWFSAKQNALQDEGHHCYVTIDGKEIEYSECCTIEGYENYKPKWDDAVLLGQTTMDKTRIVGGSEWDW